MNSPRTLAEFFEQEVLPRLSIQTLFAGIDFEHHQGRFWRGRCPLHLQAERGSFLVDRVTLRWTCLGRCKKAGQSPLAFLNGGSFPPLDGGGFRGAIAKGAALADLPMPVLREPRSAEYRRARVCEQQASLLEAFFLQSYLLLRDSGADLDAARRARSCLERHGLRLAEMPDLAIGLLGGCTEMRDALRGMGFSADEIRASELAADPRLENRLAGPIRDPQGHLLGFWARDPEDHPPRFLFHGPWKSRVAAIGLDVALRHAAGPEEPLALVEELFDALLLHAKGFPAAAAIGGPLKDLTPDRWTSLGELAGRSVVLVLNQVPSRERQIEAALESALEVSRTSRAPELYVIPGEELDGCRTVGEFVRTQGIEAFRALLRRAAIRIADSGPSEDDAGRAAATEEDAGEEAGEVPPTPPMEPEPIAPEPPPTVQALRADSPHRRRPSGFCRLHRCSQYECFCFD